MNFELGRFKWAYYNEHDPRTAAWLRELIRHGHIMGGEVDERSVEDVLPGDVAGFIRCHWFAGIGGWDLALLRAKWPDDRPVWTGSPPCQSFSTAGKGGGKLDERHLWPALFHLIGECRPPVFFGENVESSIGHGLLDTIQSDLESQGYAVGSAVLPSAGVGAQDIRSRLWFVGKRGVSDELASPRSQRCHEQLRKWDESERFAETGVSDELGDRQRTRCDGDGLQPIQGGRIEREPDARIAGSGATVVMANPSSDRCGGSGQARPTEEGLQPRPEFTGELQDGLERYGPASRFWDDADWLYCRDDKWRAVESGTYPLVGATQRGPLEMADGLYEGMVRGGDNGVPIDADRTAEARVMRLKGYGNAINPEVAKIFIESYLESEWTVA
jgi:DNA (cytosine-5)-methyltransferase 1